MVTPRWTRDGGVATLAMASAAALTRRGISVHVLAARAGSEEPVPGVTVHLSPELLNRRIEPSARLADGLAIEPAIIHLHQFEDSAAFAVMRRSAPVAVSVHGYSACTAGVHYFAPGEECARAHGPGCIPNLLLRGCAHTRDPRGLPGAYRRATSSVQTLTQADVAISHSSVVDRHLETNGVARRAVIPPFSTLEPASGSKHETRRRVVFAGRVVASKGVDVLIRAAPDVDAEFVICGDGWQLDSMRRLARRLGVLDRVRFTGWLDEAALAQQLADASIVVMPSLWPEPFGLVGIEAFSAGRPVVASDTGGVRDWLEDGVSGLCVPPGDARALARALEELLASPERQRIMGAAGKRVVEARFSAELHVTALLSAYADARANWEQVLSVATVR
jgi:glycosyltransferase involved in cell wall biosynthesis